MGLPRYGAAIYTVTDHELTVRNQMMCAMHGTWLLNVGHLFPVALTVDYRSRVIELFEAAYSVVIPTEWLSVSPK